MNNEYKNENQNTIINDMKCQLLHKQYLVLVQQLEWTPKELISQSDNLTNDTIQGIYEEKIEILSARLKEIHDGIYTIEQQKERQLLTERYEHNANILGWAADYPFLYNKYNKDQILKDIARQEKAIEEKNLE